MRRAPVLLLPALLASCGGSTPEETPAPTALVTTAAPARGEATRWLAAYGSAVPASNATETLSVNQPGQVEQVLATPGAAVRAGQPVLRFALAPSAQATYEAAATTLATARQQRATTARLLTEQLATRDQLAQADKTLADAAAAVAAARRDGAGQPRQILRAPLDGVLATVPVTQGDRTAAGAALATVARRGGIVVTVGIDPDARGAVRVGQAARLLPLDGGPPVAGRVLRVDAQLNPTTRLIDADLTFPAGALLNGQAAKAEIATGTSGGWVVPHAAVVTDSDGAHVFQVANGKARAVPVTVLQSGRDRDVVDGAIAVGQPLVVDGAFQVEDGGAVRQARR